MASLRLGVHQVLSPINDKGVAIGRPRHTKGHNTNMGTASEAEAQRNIQALEEENMKLKEDLADLSLLYRQLVREGGHETSDERRVNLLKSQLIQMERQVVLLSEGLAARSAVLLEVENSLAAIADCGRENLSKDKASKTLSVPREDLTRIVESAESGRIKLYKSIERTSDEKLQRPLVMMDRFVKQNTWEPVTMMDVCSGNINHLNIKHVGKLESRLAQLYKHLMGLCQSLHMVSSRPNENPPSVNTQLPGAVYTRLAGQVAKCCNMLHETNPQLLELSLLLPSAPWPAVQKPYMKELTADRICEGLPSFPRSKQAQGKQAINSLLMAMNYHNHMNSAEIQVLKDELEMHGAVYQLQQDYTQALFAALREGYSSFEENINEVICKPLKEILDCYDELRDTASEEALAKFLKTFKECEGQISSAINMLSSREQEGADALSEYGEKFLESLEKVQSQCQQKRDNLVSDLDLMKQQQEEAAEELLQIFPVKVEKEDNLASAYQEVIKGTATLTLNKNSPKVMSRSKEARNETVPAVAKRKGAVKKAMAGDESCSCGIDDENEVKGQTEVKDNVDFSKNESDTSDLVSKAVKVTKRPEQLAAKSNSPSHKSKLPSWRPPTPSGATRRSIASPSGVSPSATPSNLPRSNSRTRLVLKPRGSPQGNKKSIDEKGSDNAGSGDRRGSLGN